MSDLAGDRIVTLVREHEAWRAQCMNLIAAENAMSASVRSFLSGDLVHRYANYLGRDLTNRRYSGSRFIEKVEMEVAELVSETFGASDVELRAISGHVAGLAVISGICRPGDKVLELSGSDGGHRLAEKAVLSPLIELEVLPIPFDPRAYNIDTDAACRLIAEKRPRLVILGSSNFLFPHPVREIANCLTASLDTVLAYDASHVFGLIACGEFQNPLEEGAHVMFGSTHKTLPGPQGGLIVSNDEALMDAVSTSVYPGMVTNHHPARMPALAMALLEMRANPQYAQKVISNAQALGRRLHERGLPMVGAERGFSRSHTVLVRVSEVGTGRAVAAMLEEADIITSYTSLPSELGGEGVRLGTAEVTRRGAEEEDMADGADIIADVLAGSVDPASARAAVHAWAERFEGIHFCATGRVA